MVIRRLRKGLSEINEKVQKLLEERETYKAELEVRPTRGIGDYSGEVHFRVFKNSDMLEVIFAVDIWIVRENIRGWHYRYDFDVTTRLNGKVIHAYREKMGRIDANVVEKLILGREDKIKEAGFDIDKILRLLKKLNIEDTGYDLARGRRYTRTASL